MSNSTRQAVVRNYAASVETIARYMPSNYTARAVGNDVVITGHDVAGWTLDDYVIPRLASGLYFAVECQHDPAESCDIVGDINRYAEERGYFS